MKSIIYVNKLVLAILFLLLCGFNAKAQIFSSDYFTPVKLSDQQRSNNSFFYGSFGTYVSAEVEDVLDIEEPNENELTLVWFKNTRPGTKKGFEIMFKFNKRNVSYFSIYNQDYLLAQNKEYSLKISTVGTKGVAWSIQGMKIKYGMKDSLGIDPNSSAKELFAAGIEMTIGGHPYLTHKKHKWPLSWTLGARTLVSDTESMNFYTNLAIQHFVCKQRPGWYIRFDVGGGYDPEYAFMGAEEIYIRAGASTGIMF